MARNSWCPEKQRAESFAAAPTPGTVLGSVMDDPLRKPPLFPGRAVSFAVVVLGLIASVLIFQEGRREERDLAVSEFKQLALARHGATREMLMRYEEALAGLWTMFTLEENVSRAEFARATRR